MVNKQAEQKMKQPSKKAQKTINAMVALMQQAGYVFDKNDVSVVAGHCTRLTVDPQKSNLQPAKALAAKFRAAGYPCTIDVNRELINGFKYISLRFGFVNGRSPVVHFLTIDELYGTTIFQS
jgi:hypothetical protein